MTVAAATQHLRKLAEQSARLAVTLADGVPNRESARVRVRESIPALVGEPLLDFRTLAANTHALGADITEFGLRFGEAAVVEAALAGTWDLVGDHQELAVVLDYAVRPVLRAARALVDDIVREAEWTRGSCPACGALPLLAELRADKDGGTRILRCGRCDAAWPFARLACPACNEHNHKQLRYVHVDGEVDRRRAECCLTCGFYVKAVARLEPLGAQELLECDLETLGLDALALEAGYQRHA